MNRMLTVVPAVALLRLCGSSDEAPPATAAPATVTVEAPAQAAPPAAPSHGGTVVVTGPHSVEVVSHTSGQVYAWIPGDAPAPGEVELHVEVPVEGGSTRRVALEWDRRERRYEGHVRGVVVVEGPLVVHLTVGPSVWVGNVAVFVLAPAIVVDATEVVVVEHRKHRKHRKHRHRKHRDHGRVVLEVR